MMTIRPANERGHAEHGWLDSHHTFSFADYYDPAHMGFRALRVINDDRVDAGRRASGRIRIATWRSSRTSSRALSSTRTRWAPARSSSPGDVQRMSAGTGVRHSEKNASRDEGVHFLQIWIMPDKQGIEPSYEQKTFSEQEKRGRLRLVASPDGREGSIDVHSDAMLYAGLFDGGESAELTLRGGRHAWVHVARGKVRVNGRELSAGDGASLSDEKSVKVDGVDGGEVLVFDLA